jgi:hypothetical protein
VELLELEVLVADAVRADLAVVVADAAALVARH